MVPKEKVESNYTGFSAEFFGFQSVKMFCFARKTKIQMLTTSSWSLTRIHQHLFKSLGLYLKKNCIWFSFQLHVTLNQQPTNLTYMRQHIHTLELISADYFIFPRLVYPCPNLESLNIEKPTNDVFNIDAQNVPFLYGNTVPFINLKHLKMSRISLTNLSHFLSKSSNLKRFKVNTN